MELRVLVIYSNSNRRQENGPLKSVHVDFVKTMWKDWDMLLHSDIYIYICIHGYGYVSAYYLYYYYFKCFGLYIDVLHSLSLCLMLICLKIFA